jgi:hypothetical protein
MRECDLSGLDDGMQKYDSSFKSDRVACPGIKQFVLIVIDDLAVRASG